MADVITFIRIKNGITVKENDYDFDERDDIMCIDIRRNFFIQDAMRECNKKKFDPKKVIKVSLYLLSISEILIITGDLCW